MLIDAARLGHMAPAKEVIDRPEDLLPNWIDGKALCIESQLSVVWRISSQGSTAQTMVSQKMNLYSDLCSNSAFEFLPFVIVGYDPTIEVLGGDSELWSDALKKDILLYDPASMDE